MGCDHKFRFGVQVLRAGDAKEWRETARHLEDLGYAALAITDHFYNQLGPIAALMAAADATKRLQVGATVFANDFHHPVVLAKEIATLDVLSGGRVWCGLGAGWIKSEYDAAGFPYDPPKTRIDRMAEAVAILKGLFAADGPFSFEGKHYRVSNLDGRPKPVQRPHPPILIGGGGKRILSIAGREADIVSINVELPSGKMEDFFSSRVAENRTDERVAWIREAAGDRFDDVELSIVAFDSVVTSDRDAAAARLAGQFGRSPEEVLSSPHVLIGTPDQIVETLEARRERYGISFVIVPGSALEDFAPVVQRLTGS